jgi:hypothetical protein
MGLFDFLKPGTTGKHTARDAQPTVVDYVDWLFEHMLRTSRTELTLDTGATVPGAAPGVSQPPPCLPEPAAVINRLKLLAGLNPVAYPGLVEGHFEKERSGYTLRVSAAFRDTPDRASCTLRIRVKKASVPRG